MSPVRLLPETLKVPSSPQITGKVLSMLPSNLFCETSSVCRLVRLDTSRAPPMRFRERFRCCRPWHLLRSYGSSPVMLFAERSRLVRPVMREKLLKTGPEMFELDRSREFTCPLVSHPTPCQSHGSSSAQ